MSNGNGAKASSSANSIKSNENGTTCKEQCIQSKCIIQEKILDNNVKKKKESIKAATEDCTETYKKLCSCLQQCLMEKCKEQSKKRPKSDKSDKSEKSEKSDD